MNTKLTFLLALLLALGLFLAGCDCGGGNSGDDDHSGADDDADDDTVSDDDAIDDDTISDDDTVSDDDTDDDTLDDDTTPDDDADDDATPFCDWGAYDPLIVAGRDALAAYDPDTAYDQFVLARNVCPDFPDAKMGLLLSDTQWYGRMIYRWYQYLINFNPAPHDDGKSIGTVIQEIIRVSLLPVNAEMYDLIHDLRTNHPDAHL